MIAAWLRTHLWGERDWGPALARVAHALDARAGDQFADLGRAREHVVPDRRAAIAAYALAGAEHRTHARRVALSIGWYPAVARLALRDRGLGGPAGLVVDEFTAWLDAGQPFLAAAVGAEARAAAPGDPDLLALDQVVRGGDDAVRVATAIEARAGGDPRAWCTVARLARLAAQPERATAAMTQALALAPRDPAVQALALAVNDDDATAHAVVRAALHDLPPAEWIDAALALAFALHERPGARGLALRLVRAALALVTEHDTPVPRGYLAAWQLLAEHEASAGARPRLLGPLAAALDRALPTDDRLWLAALGATIAWDDAGDLDVAGAWVSVVAEHAPHHPIARAITTAVAAVHADDGLVYLDRAGEPGHAASRSRAVATALSALRDAVAAAESPPEEREVDLGDLHEPAPAPAVDVAVLTAAVDAAAEALAATPPTPPPSLIPAGARGALGKLRGRLPAIPPPPPRPDARPRATRIALPLDAVIERPHAPPLTVVCRDISTTGVFVLTDDTLELGATVALVVQLPGAEAWSEAPHQTRARVVRRESRGYGLELVTPPAALIDELTRLG